MSLVLSAFVTPLPDLPRTKKLISIPSSSIAQSRSNYGTIWNGPDRGGADREMVSRMVEFM